MKNNMLYYAMIAVIYLIIGKIELFGQNREIINIDDSWKFVKDDDPNLFRSEYDDASWDNISLPHTWNNLDGQNGDSYDRRICWYRKTFTIDDIENKQVFLKFNSVNLWSEVYLNDSLIGQHIGGYSAFIFNITKFIVPHGNNILAVKVSNADTLIYAPLSGDFTFFGGITRSVELLITDKILISPLDYASPGLYITPVINGNSADIYIKTLIANFSNSNATIEEHYKIKDADNMIIEEFDATSFLCSNSDTTVLRSTQVNNVNLWDGLESPYLYTLEVDLLVDGIPADRVTQKFGIREFRADRDSGIYLNGKRYPLYGIAFHEDRKDKGRAISDNDRKEDLEILTTTGLNYLRLSHYQHGQYTYNYCDSMGIVVWTEIPLVNEIDTTTTSFSENIKEQLKELIKQNYNHPSVFFWGIFNEQQSLNNNRPVSYNLVRELDTLAKILDAKRLTAGATNVDTLKANLVPNLLSFNHYCGWYYDNATYIDTFLFYKHWDFSDKIIGLSEYGAGASILHHEENPKKPVVLSYYHPEEYQNYVHEIHWKVIKASPFLWESSVWVGFDFASIIKDEGDTKGINDKGLVTRDRLVKKDAYYFYKANWNKDPMVYITSRRFTERNNPIVEVKAYSNIDTLLLKVNDLQYSPIITSDVIKKWNQVVLNPGNNKILVTGIKNGITIKDSCFWNYDNFIDSILPGFIQINFQPDSLLAPAGYLKDIGEVYTIHGNGLTYGWDSSNTANTRFRVPNEDTLYYTLNHMQKNNSNRTWQIMVENGTYRVSIVCGDPFFTDSRHSILIEGQNILDEQPTQTNPFIIRTDTVIVSDGKLTVSPDTNSINAKINFIHITKLDQINTTIVPGEIQINFQPDSLQPPVNYLKDNGSKYSIHTNGYEYGWDIDNSENTRFRDLYGDTVYNTLNHMQKNNSDRTWQIKVDTGIYRVSIVCGDPLYTDSRHSILIEGWNVLDESPTPSNKFIKRTVSVYVSDGKLTVTPDTNSINAKINFIHITKIDKNDTIIIPGEIQINFQPDSLPPPQNYLKDIGSAFSIHTNGYEYGWDSDNTANTRLRDPYGDILYNTLNHMQKNNIDRTWQIKVDNGIYRVSLVCGDPFYIDSRHSISVEGRNVLDESPTPSNMFIKRTAYVIVTDGKLSVTPDINSFNAKLNFIHITQLTNILGISQQLQLNNNGEELFSVSDNQIVIYPVPFHNVLNINGLEAGSTIFISNILGQVVYSKLNCQPIVEINTEWINVGMYFLTVVSSPDEVMVYKIICR